MENYGIFLRKMIEIVAKGDTFIINFQFSIIYRANCSINQNLTFLLILCTFRGEMTQDVHTAVVLCR